MLPSSLRPLLALPLACLTLTTSIAAAPPATTELIARADRGDAEAQFALARAYLRGDRVPKNPTKAWLLTKQAADQGNADAIGLVGYFYSAGVEVEKNEAEAVAWFRKGAEKGSARALLNLGLVTANGRGVPRDDAAGLKMIGEAAAKGLPEALAAEGETWFYGQFGRSVDYDRAFKHYLTAAEAGLATAQNTVGVMYREGQGVPRDHEAALKWFRRAAEQADPRGQSNLGHLLGVESAEQERRVEALTWITLAADQREITAVKTLEEAAGSLAEEVAIARLRANELQEKRTQP